MRCEADRLTEADFVLLKPGTSRGQGTLNGGGKEGEETPTDKLHSSGLLDLQRP